MSENRWFMRKKMSGPAGRRGVGRVLAVMLASSLTISALGEWNALKAEAQTGYKTVTLKKDSLAIKGQAATKKYYPKQTTVLYEAEYGPAEFVSYMVRTGDEVQVGDPIMEISLKVDLVTLEEKKLRLTRAQEALQQMIADDMARENKARKALEEASGEYYQTRYSLELESLMLSQGKSERAQRKTIEKLQKEIAVIEEAASMQYVCANTAGMVGDLPRYKVGDKLTKGAIVASVYDTEDKLYTLEDVGGVLPYGKDIELVDSEGRSYSASVVAASNSLMSPQMQKGVAYVRMQEEPEIPEELQMVAVSPQIRENLQKLTAHYYTASLDSCFVLTSDMYSSDAVGTYVLEYKDGALMRHYFTAGRNFSGTCVALDELTEGMTIVLQKQK